MQGAMISMGGYYKADMWEASARLGLHTWNINYHQKLDNNFMLMASLDGSLMQVSAYLKLTLGSTCSGIWSLSNYLVQLRNEVKDLASLLASLQLC